MRHFLGSKNMLWFIKFLDCSANFTVRSCSNVAYTCNVVNNLYLHKAIPIATKNTMNNFIGIVRRQLHYMRQCNAESKLKLFELLQTAGYRKTIANYKHSDRKSSKCPCAKPRPKIHQRVQLPKKKLNQSLDNPKKQNMKRGSTLGGDIFVPTPRPNSRSYSVDYQSHNDKICASYPLIHSSLFSSRFVGHCLIDTVNIMLQPTNHARNISNYLWYMSLRRFSNNGDDTDVLERRNNNSGGSKTNVRNSKHKIKSSKTVLLRDKRNSSMPLKFTSNGIKNSMFSDLPRMSTLMSRGPKSKVAYVDSKHSNEPRKDLLTINTNLYKCIKTQNDGAKGTIDKTSQTDGTELILRKIEGNIKIHFKEGAKEFKVYRYKNTQHNQQCENTFNPNDAKTLTTNAIKVANGNNDSTVLSKNSVNPGSKSSSTVTADSNSIHEIPLSFDASLSGTLALSGRNFDSISVKDNLKLERLKEKIEDFASNLSKAAVSDAIVDLQTVAPRPNVAVTGPIAKTFHQSRSYAKQSKSKHAAGGSKINQTYNKGISTSNENYENGERKVRTEHFEELHPKGVDGKSNEQSQINVEKTKGVRKEIAEALSNSSVECTAKRVCQSRAPQTIRTSKDTDAPSTAELKPEKPVTKLHCSKLETSDVEKVSSEHVNQNQPLSGKSKVLEDNKKSTINEELNRFNKIKEEKETSGLTKKENGFQNIAKTIPVEKLTLKFPAAMQILFEKVPLLRITDKEVLIKMDTVGICSSDVHMYETGLTNYKGEEIPLGHEGSGTIIQVGSTVKHLKFGDKITIDPTKSCGECTFCYLGRKNLCQNSKFSGVLSNYVVHSGSCCHKLPLGVTYEQGALAYPLALAIHACRQGGVVYGSKVLIIGACPVGLSAAMSAMAMGAKDVAVVDTEETNLKIAKRVGAVPMQIATNVSTEEKCQKLSSQLNYRPDIIIDTCGSTKSIDLSTNVLRPGGVNVIVGCQEENPRFPVLASLVKELNIKTSFRSNNTYSLALEMIRCGAAEVEKLITHRFEFSKAKEAFDTALNETKCNALKVVLKFPKDV